MSEMLVSSIAVGARVRKDLGDLAALAASIDAVGLLHPVVVDVDSNLVAGHRRLEAVKLLGHEWVEVSIAESVVDAITLLTAERDENTCREPFTPTEMTALADTIEALEAPKANERMKSGRPSDKLDQGRTDEKVAKAVGTSKGTLRKARNVVHTANDPTEDQDVRDAARRAQAEMDRTGKVDPAHQEVEAARRRQMIADAEDKKLEAQREQYREKAAKARGRIRGALADLDAEVVRSLSDQTSVEQWQRLHEQLDKWFATFDQASAPGPRALEAS
jgi:ParB-like chromosome segregation protein Spo0J